MITSSKSKRSFLLLNALLALNLLVPACGADDDDDDTTASASTEDEDTSAKIVFTNSALSQDGFSCGKLTLAIQDSSSVAVAQEADVVLSLSSSDSSGAFYSDSACSTKVTELTIAAAASSADVYYKQTNLASATLTAKESPDDGLTDGTQSVAMASLLLGTYKGSCTNNATSGKYEITEYALSSDGTMTKTISVYGSSDTTCASAAEHKVVTAGTHTIGDIVSGLDTTRKIDFKQVSVKITPLTATIVSSFNSSSYCSKTDWAIDTAFDTTGTACSDLNISALTANTVLYQIHQVKDSKLYLGSTTTDLDASTDAKRPTALSTTAHTKQ